MTRTARSTLLALTLALGCTPTELSTALDASSDVGASTGADAADVSATPLEDRPTTLDATPTDAAMAADTPAAQDALNVGDVSASPDRSSPVDAVTAQDAQAPLDVIAAQDAQAPRDVIAAQDAQAPRDVIAAQDAGCAVTARVVAPSADEVIETCSESGAAVFFDFRVEAAGAVARIAPRWRTPRGDLAPSPDLARAESPWIFRRQVGGASSGFPALGVFPDALRGTWRFEAVVSDRCGGERVVSQTFQLTFTNRRCPNP